jgi:hypothetical protein
MCTFDRHRQERNSAQCKKMIWISGGLAFLVGQMKTSLFHIMLIVPSQFVLVLIQIRQKLIVFLIYLYSPYVFSDFTDGTPTAGANQLTYPFP